MAVGGEMEETFPRGKKRVFDEPSVKEENEAKRDAVQRGDGLDNLFSEKPEEKLRLGDEGGGQSSLRKKTKKKTDSAAKSGRYFDNNSERKSGTKKKGAPVEKKKRSNDEPVEDSVRGAPEKYDRHVLPGTLLLGIVQEVEPYLLKMSLPGGVQGVVPINEVSVAYTQLLKTWSDSSSSTPEEEIFTMEKMFAKGSVLRVKVLSTSQDKKDEDGALRLTINPREVNMEITPTMLVKGLTLSGCVSSVEDHGYTVDIGIPGIVAFAKSEIDKAGGPRVGSYVTAVITESSPEMLKSGESRHLSLKLLREDEADPKKGVLPFTAKRDFASLLPGHRLRGKVMRTMKEGLRVSLCDGSLVAHAHFTLLRHSPLSRYESMVTSEANVKFVVVGVSPSTKLLQLSDLPHLMGEKRASAPVDDRFQVDEMLKLSVHWVLTGSNHVVFQTPKETEAGTDGNLGDESKAMKAFYNEPVRNPLKFAASKKSLMSCQVIGFALVENALLVRMKSEKATEFIAKLKSLVVGTVVQGIVKSYNASGAVVQVNNPVTVLATVSWHLMDNHKTDGVKEVESLHPVNSSIRGRVMHVDVKEGQVKLTCQPALVNSSSPILSSLRDVIVGRVYAGTICHLFPNSDSALVKFYNNLTGILFLKQALYPIELFYIGCPVLVKVVKVDMGQQKMFLNLERFDLSYVNHGGSAGVADAATTVPEDPGSVVECVILRHSSRGALVRLPSGRLSMLQRTHLSDFPEFFASLASSLQIGDRVSVVVINNEMVSAKKELIAYAEEHPSPSEWRKETNKESPTIEEAEGASASSVIQAGKTYPLIVLEQKDFGLYAVLYNGRRAFVPNKLLTSMIPAATTEASSTADSASAESPTTVSTTTPSTSATPPSSLFSVGQTLLGTVRLVEAKENRLVVNTKMKACDPHSVAKSRSIFANYLEEKASLSRGRGGEKIGTVMEVKVLESDADSVKCSANVVVEGAVNRPFPVSVGDSVEATIIDYDPVGDVLYGSLISSLVTSGDGVGKVSDEADDDDAVGDVSRVTVLRVAAPRYLVAYRPSVSKLEDGRRRLFFVGVQRFYNDLESIRKISLGQSLSVLFQGHLPVPFCLPRRFDESRSRETRTESEKRESAPKTETPKTGNAVVNELLAKDMEMFYRVNPLEDVGLKQGSVISAVVASIEPTFVRIVINDRFPGRICRSELGDPMGDVRPPKIKVGHNIKVRVVGVSEAVKNPVAEYQGGVEKEGEKDAKAEKQGSKKEKRKKWKRRKRNNEKTEVEVRKEETIAAEAVKEDEEDGKRKEEGEEKMDEEEGEDAIAVEAVKEDEENGKGKEEEEEEEEEKMDEEEGEDAKEGEDGTENHRETGDEGEKADIQEANEEKNGSNDGEEKGNEVEEGENENRKEENKIEEKEDDGGEVVPLGVVKSSSSVVLTEEEKQFAETFVIECSARRSIVHRAFMTSLHLSPPPLTAGRSIVAHVFAVDTVAKMIILKITHFSYALLPFLRACKDPAGLQKNISKQFPNGQSVKIVVDQKLDPYCYDAAVPGIVASASAPRLRAFTHTNGEVTKVTPLWAQVTLPGGVEGRIHVTDARDMYSRDPMSLMFYEGQLVNCVVKSTPTDENAYYSLSTRKSRLKNTYSAKDPEIRSVDDLLPGSLIGGFVAEAAVEDDESKPLESVEVLVSHSIRVVVKKENFPFDLTAKMMFAGKWVRRVKILSNSALGEGGRGEEVECVVEGSLKGADTGAGEMYLKQDELLSVDMERAKRKRRETEGSQMRVAAAAKKQKTGDDETNNEKKAKKRTKRRRRKKIEGKEGSSGAKTETEKDVGEEEERATLVDKTEGEVLLPRLSLDNFAWDFGDDVCGDERPTSSVDALVLDSDAEELEDVDNPNKTEDEVKGQSGEDEKSKDKRGGSKGSHLQMMVEESAIAAKEKHLLSESTPSSAEDFERLVIASPDSSIVWIHYMSFRLQEAEVEKARAVAQRALETINFREEGEKLNVWVALLNLEMNYGTEEQLLETFTRASRENDELSIKRHMAVIYASAGKHELAEKMYSGLIKKFPDELQVWFALFGLYFDHQKKESARRLMERGLQSLSSKCHIPILTKVACLEFKSGDVERGRDLFERILANFPKRLDVWTLYVDQLVSAGNIEGGRGVLDRATGLGLGAAKMRILFKKFLAFEKTHGDETRVESVKRKAAVFVEKKRSELVTAAGDAAEED